MKPKNYPLASSTWGNEEIEAMHRVISSGKFTMGQEVENFESHFADFVGSKYAVMVNSGSSANLILMSAMKYLGIPLFVPGDEIIVPAVSWSTSYYPVNQIGCKLNFVDIDIDTLNLDISKVVEAITPKTKGILAVNLLGNPCHLDQLQQIAREFNLQLIEDNCEALGGTLNAQALGTFGLGGTHSSFFSHHISTMEGGVVVTDSDELHQTMKSLRAHGWTRDLPQENYVLNKSGDPWEDLFRFALPGYNMRPIELEAAVGTEQLLKLPSFVLNRQKNAIKFKEVMSEFPEIRIQSEVGESSWFGFSLILKGKYRGKRKNLISVFARFGIETRPIVAGNFTKNPVMKHLDHVTVPVLDAANEVHENGLFIGNHHFLLEEELDQLKTALQTFSREAGSL